MPEFITLEFQNDTVASYSNSLKLLFNSKTDGKKQSYLPLLTGNLGSSVFLTYGQPYKYLETTVWFILNYFQKALSQISIVV